MVFLTTAFAAVLFAVSRPKATTTTNARANLDLRLVFIINTHLSLSYFLLLTSESSHLERVDNHFVGGLALVLAIHLITKQT